MSVFTIPAGAPFLDVLARAILGGAFAPVPRPEELPFWTIYLPTRRARPLLAAALVRASAGTALLLPQIRSIGEEADEPFEITLSQPFVKLSGTGRFFLLMRLAREWAARRPDQPLAQEIAASPARLAALAESLAQLADTLETGQSTLAALPKLLDRELSEHREAILDFLGLLTTEFPAALAQGKWASEAALRNVRILDTAQRLRAEPPRHPVIAAGSTGSIPATAEFLTVVAGLRNGAVVLPGLDTDLDEPGWAAIGDTHPQAAMKPLLAKMGLERKHVAVLGETCARGFLASEIMRPTGAADLWRGVIAARGADISSALANVDLIEAPSRRVEAAAIALVLRTAITEPGRTAALVTPDRALARGVRNELLRWGIGVDDTGGEPLSRSQQGSFVAAIAGLLRPGAREVELAALLSHPLLALDQEAARRYEIGVIRRGQWRGGLEGLAASAIAAELAIAEDPHTHALPRRFTPEDWSGIRTLAGALQAALALPGSSPIIRLRAIITALTDEVAFYASDAGAALDQLFTEVEENETLLPPLAGEAVIDLLLGLIAKQTLRGARGAHPRLKIYGLLEARLIEADWMVLGGLNEGAWPGQPDPGPWLNRPMRRDLDMMMPERQIGLSAHDFAQGFAGGARVFLTWAQRLDSAPALPSRWILRLKMLMAAAGAQTEQSPWVEWAKELDSAGGGPAPAAPPAPKPPANARPVHFSVTEIEKLIRDPYAIYAKRILRLTPLDPLVQRPDGRLRGELVHAALQKFAEEHPGAFPEDGLSRLLAIGRGIFAPFMREPDVKGFWWPRFENVARWFAGQDRLLRDNVSRVWTETRGEETLGPELPGHTLSARADRIDILQDGSARLIDYKTGTVPSKNLVKSGLSPQLTLEAALLAHGAFKDIGSVDYEAFGYLKLTGDAAGGDEKFFEKNDYGDLPEKHFKRMKGLLAAYAREGQPYLARVVPQFEKDKSDYDHLSRYREWASGGGDA